MVSFDFHPSYVTIRVIICLLRLRALCISQSIDAKSYELPILFFPSCSAEQQEKVQVKDPLPLAPYVNHVCKRKEKYLYNVW